MKNPVIKFVSTTTVTYKPSWDILLNGEKIGDITTKSTGYRKEQTVNICDTYVFTHESQANTKWEILEMLKEGRLSVDPEENKRITALERLARKALSDAMKVVDTVSHDSGNYSLIVATRRNGEKSYAIRSIEQLDYAPKMNVYNGEIKRIDINTRESGGYASTDEAVADMLTRMLDAVKARKAFLAIIADYESKK